MNRQDPRRRSYSRAQGPISPCSPAAGERLGCSVDGTLGGGLGWVDAPLVLEPDPRQRIDRAPASVSSACALMYRSAWSSAGGMTSSSSSTSSGPSALTPPSAVEQPRRKQLGATARCRAGSRRLDAADCGRMIVLAHVSRDPARGPLRRGTQPSQVPNLQRSRCGAIQRHRPANRQSNTRRIVWVASSYGLEPAVSAPYGVRLPTAISARHDRGLVPTARCSQPGKPDANPRDGCNALERPVNRHHVARVSGSRLRRFPRRARQATVRVTQSRWAWTTALNAPCHRCLSPALDASSSADR